MVSRWTLVGLGVVVSCATGAFGEPLDSLYQARAIANLKPNDTIVVSNSGASSTQVSPQNGTLCANVYAMAASTGLLVECCSCRVAPNAMVALSVVNDVLAHPKKRPKSLVLKLVASSGINDVCNGGTVGTGGETFVTGMLVWKDQIPFTPATLSAAELAHLTAQCGTLHATGNTCPVCQTQ